MSFHVPLIIRGRIIADPDLQFGGRRGGAAFTTADVKKHLAELPLSVPSQLAELHAMPFEEILDYLDQLGGLLNLNDNPYLQEAFELSSLTSGLSADALRHFYSTVGLLYQREAVREHAENTIGVKYLDGWVERQMASGCIANIRAFGVRSVHVLAGNVPVPAAMGVIRNAITRSDAIFKTPSNDPITAAAIARTMIEMAPNHPITRHLSIAYWKGGDAEVEDVLYRPDHIEKIVAWGGEASMTHITKYIQPGIDLVAMDPKLSSSIIGREAFTDDATMREVAARLAIDIGYLNQQACASARVVYIQTGTDAAGIAKANRFGKMVFDAVLALPSFASGPAARLTPQLAEELQSLRVMSEEHAVYGGGREGAVIVSQVEEPVDFAALLTDRVANLVPFSEMETPIRSVNSYTQTIGIYPDRLKAEIRDRLIFNGAQRLTSVGYMLKAAMAGPHDGIEPVRRMCKWIIDESSDPARVPLLSSASQS
jgi:hypothetical protein